MIQAYQYYQHPPFWKIAVLLVFFLVIFNTFFKWKVTELAWFLY